MFTAVVVLSGITVGGLALSYLYKGRRLDFFFRLAASHIIGSVLFSTVLFILACAIGFSKITVITSFLITLAPALLFTKGKFLLCLKEDLREIKEKLKELSPKRIVNATFYFLLFLLMFFFFQRAIIESSEGIFTGAGHNLGDLPLHLGIIFSFTEANNFPPINPSFTYTKLTYPFMSDLIAASLFNLGSSISEAFLVQNLFLIFSTILLLERFVYLLTNSSVAGKAAILILLFCGGLGFVDFFRDYWTDGRSITEFLWNLKEDYTIRSEGLRWGNSLTTLFITQRSILFGFPLALFILIHLWETFSSENNSGFSKQIFVGFLTGCLPLIHVHTLLVIFVVCSFLFFFSLNKWHSWIAFGLTVSVIAIPELIWLTVGSATDVSKFFEFHFGWDKADENFFLFWVKNLGLFIPLLIFGLFLAYKEGKRKLIIFYAPFAFCFLLANSVKLAPWEWDNIKVLIYWFTGSIVFVFFALERIWRISRILSLLCFTSLILAGALDVWRTASGQILYDVFSADSVKIAEIIKKVTPPQSVFLNAPTYNSAVVLSGRQSLIRYTGHLESYGIDYKQREEDVKKMYKGGSQAEALMRKYGINYVIVSPEEWANLSLVNEDYFAKFPIVAQSGAYKVYEIRKDENSAR
ncbi:MAG: hypothetical protein N2Z23_09385 [Pyrinomonadaceae bacterium]|nr:hypothetical protein [Pyrinomonadaceae bacterium]MCX7640635.1 hypothetical protein [Pyrinomonadaceae bacterium]MDW8305336.1 hypothetical protein [Acidobacteriota bacterium]